MPRNRRKNKTDRFIQDKWKRLAWIGFGLSVLNLPAHALSGKPYPYRVMPGESLSSILYRLNIAPIYGPGRNLEKTLEMNPKLAARNGEVQSGERIFLPMNGAIPPADFPAPEQSKKAPLANPGTEVGAPIIEKPAAAADTPSPALAENRNEIPETGFSELEFSLAESFLKVESRRLSNGAMSSLGSQPSTTAELTFRPHLSDENFLEFGASLQRIALSDAPNRIIENQAQNYIRVFGGFVRRLNERWQIGINAGQNEELFYHAVSLSSVRVEKVGVGFANLHARYQLTEVEQIRFLVLARVGLHFAFSDENFQGSTGTAYGLGLGAEKTFGTFVLSSALSYSHDAFPMDSFHFDRSELGLKIGFHYLFGGSNHENAP